MILFHALQTLQQVVHLMFDLRELSFDGLQIICLHCFGSSSRKSHAAGAIKQQSIVMLWHLLVRELLWMLLEDEEKLVLVRRLPPPLRLTLGRFEGMTARDKGGGGGGTRDG